MIMYDSALMVINNDCNNGVPVNYTYIDRHGVFEWEHALSKWCF